MICPKCGAENPAGNRFCDNCGTKLETPPSKKQTKPKATVPEAARPAPGPGPAAESLSPGRQAVGWLTWENLLWLAVLAVTVWLRFYVLGEKPLHHDESLHAFYAWNLFKGAGYSYDPMMHGPFLFHANALIYYLFGASDFTCRIMPALASLGCVIMAYALRPYLGRAGALFTGALLALSPSFTYFGRFIRNDIYISAFSLLMIYGLFRWLDTRRAGYLYLGAAALSLAFSTKEVTYIIGFIFVSFLFFRWLWEYTARPPAEETQVTRALGELWRSRRALWISCLVFFGIVALLYTTMFTHLRGFFDAFTKSLTYWLGQHEVQRGSQPVYFYAALLPLYELLPLLGAIAALIYYSFIRDRQNRAWRLLAYVILGAAWWLFVEQGRQTFGLVFALVLITLGTGLLAYFSYSRRNLFVVFLSIWTLAAFSDLSFAGERMPWLILHPLLPMVLLCGYFLGELWERFPAGRVWLAVAVAVPGTFLIHNTSLLNFYGAGANPAEQLVYVQTSTDVPQVVRQITSMSKRLTGGLDMKITCEDYCSWPFAWYLRDFKYVGYPKFTAGQAPGTIEENPLIISGVEMAAPGHDDRVAELLAEKYIAQRYKLRVWWAPDAQAFFNDTLGGKLEKAWKLFMYREPWSGLGSYDMIVYVRKDVAYLYWANAQ